LSLRLSLALTDGLRLTPGLRDRLGASTDLYSLGTLGAFELLGNLPTSFDLSVAHLAACLTLGLRLSLLLQLGGLLPLLDAQIAHPLFRDPFRLLAEALAGRLRALL